jgi:hypothetical protein
MCGRWLKSFCPLRKQSLWIEWGFFSGCFGWESFRFACLDTPRKQRTYVGFVGGIDFEATSFGFGALAEELKCGFG